MHPRRVLHPLVVYPSPSAAPSCPVPSPAHCPCPAEPAVVVFFGGRSSHSNSDHQALRLQSHSSANSSTAPLIVAVVGKKLLNQVAVQTLELLLTPFANSEDVLRANEMSYM